MTLLASEDTGDYDDHDDMMTRMTMNHGVMTIKWTNMNKSGDLRTGQMGHTDRQPVNLFQFLPGFGASFLVVMCNLFQCI